MAKYKVIIADTDVGYIPTLQLQFAEKCLDKQENQKDKVEVEIITDPAYFETYFNTPQRVNALIVSEELYTPTLQRHNIDQIFLMTERPEEEQTGDLIVNRIFKYTSIKMIWNEIVAKCPWIVNDTHDPMKTQVIMVYSASGGAGKTTVALGLCACMARNYKKVLYLNAERLQALHSMVDNRSAISAADIYSRLTAPGDHTYQDIKHVIRQEGFYYLPPFKASLMSLHIPYSVFTHIITGAKKSRDYDYIVVDADSTFDDDKAVLLDLADKVVMVTRQSLNSVLGTNTLVGSINGATGEKYLYICNDFDKDGDNALISPGVSLKFTVAEYIEHFDHYDQKKIADIAKEKSIQRATVLLT